MYLTYSSHGARCMYIYCTLGYIVHAVQSTTYHLSKELVILCWDQKTMRRREISLLLLRHSHYRCSLGTQELG